MNTTNKNSSTITLNLFSKSPITNNFNTFVIIIPLIAIVIRLIIFLIYPFAYEDAFITFRYAENFANGLGLVYNAGEMVYGTTTPLFALILAFFYYFGVPCILSALAINLLAEAITSIIVYNILKEYSNGVISFCISLLYVFSPSNISWSVQGMETAFFSSLIALSFYNLYKQNYFYAVLFAFFGAITRIDGLSVVAIVSVFTIYEKRFSSLRIFFLPILIFISWLVFLYLYFGSILPNSMLAKLILYSGHNPSFVPSLKLVFSKFFEVGYYSSSIITLLFLVGIFIVLKVKRRLLPMIIWFFVYYIALIFSKTSIHGWYLIPPLFVFITISGIGIVFMFDKILTLLKLNKQIVIALLLFSIIVFSSIMLFFKIKQLSIEYQYEQTVRLPIGIFLNDNTSKNATVFLEPIGVIGYYSKRYIYDDAALVSPLFLEINKLPYNAISRYKKIDLVKPDYLVLRDIYLSDFYETTNLQNDYTIFNRFVNQSNTSDSSSMSMTIFKRKNIPN